MASTTKKKTSTAKKKSTSSKAAGSKAKSTRKTTTKSKATRPASSSKKRSTASKKKKKGLRHSRMLVACLIVLFWIFSLITLFSMGIIGRFFNQSLQIIMGSFLYILLPYGMVTGFRYIWNGGKRLYSTRAIIGFILFALCWMTIAGLLSTSSQDPYLALSTLQSSLAFFGSSAFLTHCGFIGAGLAGLLVSMFSTAGAWLLVIGLLAMSLCLMFWPQIDALIFSPMHEAAEDRTKNQKAAKKKTKSRILDVLDYDDFEDDEIDEPSITIHPEKPVPVPAPAPIQPVGSVFENGILMDGLNEPQVPADSLVQDRLPGFEIPTADEKKKAAPSQAAAKRQELAAAPMLDPVPAGKPDAAVTNAISNALSMEDEITNQSEAAPAEFPVYDPAKYKLPPINLLEENKAKNRSNTNVRNARVQGQRLIEILKQFNVDATLGEVHIGPSVTEFEVIPGQGVRVSAFTNLQNDIKMALAATDIRVEAPIPGKSAVGIEVPNAEKTTVTMKELIRNVPPKLQDKPLMFTLGKDLMGNNVYGRLDTMPHLLIAGATGSGKSVCVNSIICSILLRTRPDEVKLLLVDPKKVEFTPYNGIPHLLSPVITDANLASGALKVIVEMMDARYSLFEELTVRNISSYNEYVKQNPDCGKQVLPRIVVIIDELADLMLAASKDVEQSIQRITQLARAAGIHLIVATQRPSVNVITGVIKANIPSRIAFMVSSRPDSRTILDQSGAEKLLGYGDMLFLDNGAASPVRLQGVFIQDKEVEEICNWVKNQATPQYEDAFVMLKEISTQGGEVGAMAEEMDPLYPEVKNFVITSRKASTSLIQRRFRLGYGRAARILDQLEANGIIGPSNGSRPREILVERNADDAQEEFY